MALVIDFTKMSADPTYHRIIREDLESLEGTPRAVFLQQIEATEFAITTMLDTARDGGDVTFAAGRAYDALNALYLLVSPETLAAPVLPLLPTAESPN